MPDKERFIAVWAEYERMVTETAIEKGFLQTNLDPLAACCLMHAEISEAVEAFRKPTMPPDKHVPAYNEAEVELADLVIRLMVLARTMKLNIPAALHAKAEYNKTREFMHGKTR